MHLWSFAYTGGSSPWNPYAAQKRYLSPVFLTRDTALPTKALAAMRDGIQDYAILRMLQTHADAAGVGAAEAAALLTRGVEEVLAPVDSESFQWSDSRDRTAADRIREEALGLLSPMGEARSGASSIAPSPVRRASSKCARSATPMRATTPRASFQCPTTTTE